MLTGLTRYRDGGLFALRIGIGVAFLIHGLLKLTKGPNAWHYLAIATGIQIIPVVFGFVAAACEVVGGVLLVLGMAFRLACIILLLTMCAALNFHIRRHDLFENYSHALESAVIFLSLIFIGPGRYSVDRR
jgi:putative oxidoreductase